MENISLGQLCDKSKACVAYFAFSLVNDFPLFRLYPNGEY